MKPKISVGTIKSNFCCFKGIIIVFDNIPCLNKQIIRNHKLNYRNRLEILFGWNGGYKKMAIDIIDIAILYE